MKRVLQLLVLLSAFNGFSQSFPIINANDDYVVTNLKGSDRYKDVKEVIRDRNGLYYFQNIVDVFSFDGVNWKSYRFSNANGRVVPVRVNEIELTDSIIWLATSEGLFAFNPLTEKFVSAKEKFPGLAEMPVITNCIYKGIGNFLMVSFIKDGFYIFDWKKGEVEYVRIDSSRDANLELNGIELFVTIDKLGNYWGVTKENHGIWCYNPSTNEIKRSWKAEIFSTSAKRLQGKSIKSITYSPNDNSLLLSYGSKGILEKLFLNTGKSHFYTITRDLHIRNDTNSTDRLGILRVKVDPRGNEWLLLTDQYLVRIDKDLRKCEYLNHDPELLPLGKMDWLLPETNMKPGDKTDDNLLWILGDKGLNVLKKRRHLVKQIPYEEKSVDGITPGDYLNRDVTRETGFFKNIFFVRGLSDNYFILQQNAQRPKLIVLDKNLRVSRALLNDKWRQSDAYFNPMLDSDSVFMAMLRPGVEPLNFRTCVVKDVKINLRTLTTEEINLDFHDRVYRYGATDAENVRWLFSNGFLYSYDLKSRTLDSIFICEPRSKRPYPNSRIKGYDFPTLLHKESATFWISFISDKELYKIDLKKRKVSKVIKSCLDRKDCLISSVLQLHLFDSSRIYLKQNMAAVLLNPFTDSVTFYSDLFENKLPFEDCVSSLKYKDWLCNITTYEANFQNVVTGRQKRLLFNQDFKWKFSTIFIAPPVNDNGEMVLMSSAKRGFVVFNIDSIPYPPSPENVRLSLIRLNEKDLPIDSVLQYGMIRLKYNKYNSIRFKFSDRSILDQDKIHYEYTLYSGGDTMWNRIEGEPEITLSRITPGKYDLLIRAGNGFGDYSPKVTSFGLLIKPPFTQTIWFILLIVLLTAAIVFTFYQNRLQQLKKLQMVRNNIASDLHDDIGSTLNSISIYSEVAKQQAKTEIPALELIGQNSRKIIESMSDIVWTINPENDSFEKIIVRMRSFAYQLFKARDVEYTFEAADDLDSIPLAMRVRKNFYLVFKEAITNIVKYSQASRVKISLISENNHVLLRVQDNGKGIPVNAETHGNGLMNMKRRADEINGRLVINSDHRNGTSIEFSLKVK